jgi:ATP-dependent DNA ligase
MVNIARGKVGFIEPMLILPVAKVPEGSAWSYELKFDGYRARCEGGRPSSIVLA